MRVARLHKAGVLHNDLEPRNVVLSRHLGPRVIDFDNATMDHTCGGISCKELSELSRCLGLDLGELDPNPTFVRLIMYIRRSRTFQGHTPAAHTLLAPAFIFLSFVDYHVHGDA